MRVELARTLEISDCIIPASLATVDCSHAIPNFGVVRRSAQSNRQLCTSAFVIAIAIIVMVGEREVRIA